MSGTSQIHVVNDPTAAVRVRAAAADGSIEDVVLPATVRVAESGLGDYRSQLERLLRTGHAQVSCVEIGDVVEPMALVAGGWPVEGVCCGAPAPDCDDILVGGVGRQLWECRACGSTVWPDTWAVTPLTRAEGGGWDLPEPAHLSWACNIAVANLLYSRETAAADRACAALRELQSGSELSDDVSAAAWLSQRRPRSEVGSVWALVGARVGDQPAGQIFTGFIGHDRNGFDHKGRRWQHSWRDAAWGKVTASQAARLLGNADELATRAAAGTLSEDALRAAWRSVETAGAEMPEWLFDSAAVEDLAQTGRTLGPAGRSSGRGLSL